MKKRSSYVARYERDEDGYWSVVVHVSPGRAAISDGQTLPKARRRIRQAVAALLDAPEASFDLVDDVRLGAAAARALKRLRASQARLKKTKEEAEAAQAAAASVLTSLGISRRDAGEVLGVTGQRVQQLMGRR